MNLLQSRARQEQKTRVQRFEAKYLLTELEACAVRDFIEPYVRTDPNVVTGREYPISSLYLDSPDMKLYWSSTLGEKNRMKLRIRTYGENREGAVFLEIKRRIDGIVSKQRAKVHRDLAVALLRGEYVSGSVLDAFDDEERENFFEFRDYLEVLPAIPRAAVRYMREAYVSDLDESVRITFDRNLACAPCFSFGEVEKTGEENWFDVPEYPLIMEIKFTDRYPYWVTELIRRFHLARDSIAKYVVCVKTLNRHGIRLTGS